jgi:CPA2 family monovalent cation:H+ antiporter-2
MAAAMALGQPWSIALAIGLVMALSSTAIVLQTLNEKGLMKSDGGQSSFSVLLFQDIAVIPMLALIPLLALPELVDMAGETASHGTDTHATESHSGGHGDDHSDDHGDGHGSQMSLVDGLSGWQTALVTIGAIAAVILGGSYLTGPIFRFIAGAQLRELFTATALMIVIGIALLMSLVGLSPALGTFLAGVVLAEYRHELESDIDPFKGLLLGLFFMTVGAGINFALLMDNLGGIIALTFGLILIKILVLLILGRIFKLEGSDKWLFGLGLAQAGEFGFVLLSFTVANAVIPSDVADQLLLIVALSMLLTPALFILYDRVIVPRYTVEQDREADEITEHSNIIIAGHGRVGGLVARMLRAGGHTPTVIDFSAKQLEMLSKFGIRAYYGDATRPDLLHSAGIHEAKILVVAIDGQEQITELVKYVSHTHPHVHVVARAVARHHVYDLWAAGCRDIIRDYYDSSLRMGRSAYEALGVPRDKADEIKEAFNAVDSKSMLELAEHYDPDIPTIENEVYVAKVREMATEWEAELNVQINEILARSEAR